MSCASLCAVLLRSRAAKCAASDLAASHQHLLDPVSRKLICACDACAILFSSQGQTKYKRVPRRIRFLADFRMTDSQWDGLMMPINMAFFFKSTPQGRVMRFVPKSSRRHRVVAVVRYLG